jgi:hypothetical protein
MVTTRNIKRTAKSVSLIVLTWLTISFGLYIFSGRIIHHPYPSRIQEFQIPHEQIFVKNPAGEKIDMLWAPQNDIGKHKTHLYLHGNAGRLPFIVEALAREGNLLSPAYPGYSASEGRPDTKNVGETVDLAIEFLRSRGIESKDVIVLGHSLGGSPAVYAAAQYPEISKVILVNTFYSMKSMCESLYKIFCVFAGGIHDTAAIAPLARAPIRQFHVKDDKIVPFEQGRALFEIIGSPDKKFTIIQGSHADFDVDEVLTSNNRPSR